MKSDKQNYAYCYSFHLAYLSDLADRIRRDILLSGLVGCDIGFAHQSVVVAKTPSTGSWTYHSVCRRLTLARIACSRGKSFETELTVFRSAGTIIVTRKEKYSHSKSHQNVCVLAQASIRVRLYHTFDSCARIQLLNCHG